MSHQFLLLIKAANKCRTLLKSRSLPDKEKTKASHHSKNCWAYTAQLLPQSPWTKWILLQLCPFSRFPTDFILVKWRALYLVSDSDLLKLQRHLSHKYRRHGVPHQTCLLWYKHWSPSISLKKTLFDWVYLNWTDRPLSLLRDLDHFLPGRRHRRYFPTEMFLNLSIRSYFGFYLQSLNRLFAFL